MAAQLPAEYEPLLQAAGVGRRRAAGEPSDLALRVAELAGLEPEAVPRAADAVLETLAVRILAGEVEDLKRELRPNLHARLERGPRESREAHRMSVDEFLATSPSGRASAATRRSGTAARFAALRELISGKEFSDVAAQLPEDYAPPLAAPA